MPLLGSGSLDETAELIAKPGIKVIGLVVNTVDDIMHGMELGQAGMHNQVRLWAEQGFIMRLLDLLLNSGFRITITSDHGNLEAEGIGRPTDGVIAEARGERMRIYTDRGLRTALKVQYPNVIDWAGVGLPDGVYPVLAPGRSAFTPRGGRIVGHGGISIEELIVPLVQVERWEK